MTERFINTTLLSFDPGQKCGFARWGDEGKLLESGIITGDSAVVPARMIKNLKPAAVVYEGLYINKQGAKRKGFKQYCYRALLFKALCEAFQLPHTEISHKTWRAYAEDEIPGGLIPGGQKTDSKNHPANKVIMEKARIVARAHGWEEERIDKIETNEADAILIGAFKIFELRIEARDGN